MVIKVPSLIIIVFLAVSILGTCITAAEVAQNNNNDKTTTTSHQQHHHLRNLQEKVKKEEKVEKVTICRKTGSFKEPFKYVKVSKKKADKYRAKKKKKDGDDISFPGDVVTIDKMEMIVMKDCAVCLKDEKDDCLSPKGGSGMGGGGDGKKGEMTAVTGDPHFVTWVGEKFDFHGGCDLVLLQNPDFNNGQGMYINIRTKIVRWWSYVESAVIKIGQDTLEVMGGTGTMGDIQNRLYYVNGKKGKEGLGHSKMMSFTIGGYPVRYRGLNEHQFQFKIFLNNDAQSAIVLKAVKDFMRVDIDNPTYEDFGTSVGLMGSFDDGDMLARDGVTVMSAEDPIEFGKEWQVRAGEPMLFHNIPDGAVQHPEVCAMPEDHDHGVTSEERSRRRLLEEGSIINPEQAAIACSKVSPDQMSDCVLDVMATNDEEMAAAFY